MKEVFNFFHTFHIKHSFSNYVHTLHHCALSAAATDDHNSINAQTVPSTQSRAGQGRAGQGTARGRDRDRGRGIRRGLGLASNPQMLSLGGLKFEMPTTTTVNCHICFGLLSDCQTDRRTVWLTDEATVEWSARWLMWLTNWPSVMGKTAASTGKHKYTCKARHIFQRLFPFVQIQIDDHGVTTVPCAEEQSKCLLLPQILLDFCLRKPRALEKFL